MENKIKLGCSLYSLSKEFAYDRTHTLEQCLEIIARVGGKGFEIVAAQSIPGYPYPSDDFVYYLKGVSDKYGLQPVSYGAYIDKGLRSDREMTEKEIIAATLWDIQYAAKLGCSVMRTQHLISPAILEKIIPYAEAYDVKVGPEMHAPHTFETPVIQEFLELFARCGSSHIGLIPDFGMAQNRPGKLYIDSHVINGGNEKILKFISDSNEKNVPKEETLARVKEMGGNSVDISVVDNIYSRFYPMDLKAFKEAMPYCIYFHGKFYYMDEQDRDPGMPYEEIYSIIRDSGFEGWINSEFEGHGMSAAKEGTAEEMLRRHQRMLRKILY
jgi:sugar phosphate isomerase/epimerase